MTRNHLLYFGRTMPFTDNDGTTHAESFWKLEQFSIDTGNRILYVQFVAYASIGAFNSGDASLIQLGGSWTKTYTGEAYDKLIQKFAQAVAGVAVATWNIADSVIDTPNSEGDFESFFKGASAILMPEGLM